MALPDWSDWPAVLAAQKEDVTTPGQKYPGTWYYDQRNWVPEVADSGVVWTTIPNVVNGEADFVMTLRYELNSIRDLWTKVTGEETQWTERLYPD